MSITCLPFQDIENQANELIFKYYINENREGFNLYGKTKCFLPSVLSKKLQVFEHFEVRDDDIIYVAFPRTGTAWAQELTWLIRFNLDFETAKKSNILRRAPILDTYGLYNCANLISPLPLEEQRPEFVNSVKYITDLPSPRYFKIHFPWELLPLQIKEGTRKPKIIYVARNPKDACVDLFHLCILRMEGFKGSLDDFCEMFLNDRVLCAPFWEHINEFWKRRNDSNIYYLRRRDILENLSNVINQMSIFLDKPLSDIETDLLTKYMENYIVSNPAINSRIILKLAQEESNEKKAEKEDHLYPHVKEMSKMYNQKFDKWIQENLIKYNLPSECF